MSRLSKKSPSVCTDCPLSNSEIYRKISLMRQILSSSFGPKGRLKQLHNNVGGHVITTSTSSVLLQAVPSSEPLLKLITASILNHVSRFSDCGLFTGILCFSLIHQARESGLRGSVAIEVYRQILGMCTSYLNQEDCSCKVKIDYTSSQSLVTLAHTVISSKPACMLTERELQHVSTLTVQAFLLSVPCNSPEKVCLGRTVTVPIEGQPVLDSVVFPGLLVEAPEMLSLTNVDKLSVGLRLVLFNVSLSGDLAGLGEGTVEVQPGADPESDVLEQLLKLGEQAVKENVVVFACQKVIHPVLQHYLRRHNVVVIERLGVTQVEPILQMTGAQPVSTFYCPIPPGAYGQVKGVTVKQFGSKQMLHLLPVGESVVCTMVLCHRNETMLSELRVACGKAERVLRLTLREPSALLGGGCTETHLAAHIRHKSLEGGAESACAVGCSQAEYLLGTRAFCCSLESVARALEHEGGECLIDLSHAHRWTVPRDEATRGRWGGVASACGCGLLENRPGLDWTPLNCRYLEFPPAGVSRTSTAKPRLLDSFTAKLNALQVAVETANLVLDIRYIIQDVN
ncbi:McKusick-Kaufman/Bardet-Biedl syndromes putative chaperonin [Osmerus eperlanus]|uniref:McKusick-Kaufman/Bardet-Biedl syndromes putative chaperonin n=1 Tax=Osmerus eperlanus TaxID=29151 RepID=UPI002E133949